MRFIIKYLIFIILVFTPNITFGLIEVDITRGNLNPLPIAVSPLFVEEQSAKNFEKIFNINIYIIFSN